jgi:hypothetical protein
VLLEVLGVGGVAGWITVYGLGRGVGGSTEGAAKSTIAATVLLISSAAVNAPGGGRPKRHQSRNTAAGCACWRWIANSKA